MHLSTTLEAVEAGVTTRLGSGGLELQGCCLRSGQGHLESVVRRQVAKFSGSILLASIFEDEDASEVLTR